ncbi:hypothetical protein [Sulfurimonas marina]|uniref:Capsule biosynthesis protein n=1 Tax=Sulfurimonas marina TaxID=2590551 RepID=A0A7M1AVH3_9BACT|nr:hypothetical protein [Sulfurimonas marina]QOP41443.1 hypothetical protein FJR03_06665 [Sulfurimonas marina]
MIKKLIQLFWFEKTKKEEEHRTLRKNFARIRRHGLLGMIERLNKEYEQIDQDYITKSILNARYAKLKLRSVFLVGFLLSSFYIVFLKSELYESKTALIVRDMNQNPTTSTLGLSLLGMGSSSQLQDSKIVEEYLKSLDVYTLVDQKFHLTEHYKSDAIDFVERLSDDATQEEVLDFYNKHLIVYYDEVSGILSVAFAHVDPKKAQEILEFLVQNVDYQINEFNRKKAKKQLTFVEGEFSKAKEKMEHSTAELEAYQNKHLLLDPTTEAISSSGIIAELEASLTQKQIEYATKKSYLNEDNFELVNLKNEIIQIKQTIEKTKKSLTGNEKNPLNKVLIAYEKLKMQLEFDTEVYKNALIQLETTKIDVAKNDKTLSVVSKPNLPDGYTYPNKPKAFITILIITLLMYGIFSMLSQIIKDHKE